MLPAAMPTLLRALGCWGDGTETKAAAAIERWRQAEGGGADVHDAVVAIAELREQISKHETQWRQQSARLAPPPRLAKSVMNALAGPEGAVAVLRERGKRLADLMNDGRIFRHDVEEWHLAKVEEAVARGVRLVEQATALRERARGP